MFPKLKVAGWRPVARFLGVSHWARARGHMHWRVVPFPVLIRLVAAPAPPSPCRTTSEKVLSRIVTESIARAELERLAEGQFGDMVKAVVDVARRIMALGGELHSDDEAALLDEGSLQHDLWGINLYPGEAGEDWIEFDSMINVRPSQGNRSRDVEDEEVRASIREIVESLVSRDS